MQNRFFVILVFFLILSLPTMSNESTVVDQQAEEVVTQSQQDSTPNPQPSKPKTPFMSLPSKDRLPAAIHKGSGGNAQIPKQPELPKE